MTIDELEPAAPELRELFEAERGVPALPREVSERLAERLSHTLGLPPLPTPPTAPPPPAAAASSIAQGAKAAGVAATGLARVIPFALTFAAGTLTGALAVTLNTHAPVSSNPAAPAPTSALARPSAPERAPAPAPPPEPLRTPPPAPAPAIAADSPRDTLPRDPPRDLGDSGLGAERQLLELAHNALARGRADEALAALERHARRFPRGRLGEERDSMRVPTLVVLGRGDDARRAAERFHARYPHSLFAPVVQRAIEAIP